MRNRGKTKQNWIELNQWKDAKQLLWFRLSKGSPLQTTMDNYISSLIRWLPTFMYRFRSNKQSKNHIILEETLFKVLTLKYRTLIASRKVLTKYLVSILTPLCHKLIVTIIRPLPTTRYPMVDNQHVKKYFHNCHR